ncbi:MAG: SLBB domain-containing protein [Solirubrobacterales bacterium]|nr:SLBB domain-containing protein [Solirubrobacterales bacterium]
MSLPRLLRGLEDVPLDRDGHGRVHGELPADTDGRALVAELRRARLRGRGGGGFPLAIKLKAVRRGRRPAVLVVNGCEGEPLSIKDHLLLTRLPHLVIDGALALARAAGAADIRFALDEGDLVGDDMLNWALDARPELRGGRIAATVAAVPSGYVSGQETGLVRWHNEGVAAPTSVPPRVTERGIGRRPTLVSNVETVAHVALIARHGAEWFAQLGTAEEPGTALVTLAGAVARPGVYEIALGTRLGALLDTAGGAVQEIDAYLVGGYAGTWVPAPRAGALVLCEAGLRAVGARLGSGVILALPTSACPVAEMARVTRWLASESSGQCGPCVRGLGAIADAFESIAAGGARPSVLDDLTRWCRLSRGRGACAHPDGVAQLVTSALDLFSVDLLDHARHGPCDACERPPQLTVPAFALRG